MFNYNRSETNPQHQKLQLSLLLDCTEFSIHDAIKKPYQWGDP